MRITMKDLERRIERINRIVGLEGAEYGTPGLYVLRACYGAYGVSRCVEGGGERDMFGLATTKEVWAFLAGLECTLEGAQ